MLDKERFSGLTDKIRILEKEVKELLEAGTGEEQL